MSEIKGLKSFKKPTNIDSKRVNDIVNEPLNDDLKKICESLSKD